MIKVYEVSRKYIMLFMRNNGYLHDLTGLLTLLQRTIQPAPIVHREIFEISKNFMKFYTANFNKSVTVAFCREVRKKHLYNLPRKPWEFLEN